ncbi:methyltransferase domain-containing protein [Nocardia brasiliensis]|uniref:Methyltransferase domain-containing protein n=1 Tax=Nocardia brasiliensis TaxID=37326 RepID=A0A6G9XXP6_NOCBR|nr:class I SAM-dependent methyltransferase [Nocardia brasiliensis]QIS05715.1 methyltransferase domain-containing protein [Nocardia brasiliensis]
MTETHSHGADAPEAGSTVEFWENFYQERERVWSGNPNFLLVREITGVPAGTALDLGCAEGADAIWLAQHGWRVTGVDVAETALGRARAHAAELGVTGITWQQVDLAHSFPEGTFDLVSAQYLHSPVAHADERTTILSRAAAAVAPGGLLLIVGHATWPSWVSEPPADIHFPTTAEVLAGLRLDPAEWTVARDELAERDQPSPEGMPGTRKDNLLLIRRH